MGDISLTMVFFKGSATVCDVIYLLYATRSILKFDRVEDEWRFHVLSRDDNSQAVMVFWLATKNENRC